MEKVVKTVHRTKAIIAGITANNFSSEENNRIAMNTVQIIRLTLKEYIKEVNNNDFPFKTKL